MSNKQSRSLSVNSLALYGCIAGFIVAFGLVVAGVFLFANGGGEPIAFRVGLIVTGLVEAWVCYLAIQGNRAGWSFALAISGTLTVAFLFGAPSVAEGLETSTVVGGSPSVLLLLTTIFLAVGSDEY